MTVGRRIAIDVGTVRIGVAASDFHGILASPLATVTRKADLTSTVADLMEIINEVDAVQIFIGLPINLRGAETKSTDDALTLARALSAAVQVPVFMVDERLSTVAAAGELRASGKNSKQSRGVIDQIAATVILESVLAAYKAQDGFVGREIGSFDV